MRSFFLFGSIEFHFIFDADYVRELLRVAHVMCRDVEVTEIGLYGSERRFTRV